MMEQDNDIIDWRARGRYHCDTARNYLKHNDLEQALSECDKAIESDPDLAAAYNLRGNILERLDKLSPAEEAYRKAIDSDPDYEEAKQNLKKIRSRSSNRSKSARSPRLVTVRTYGHPVQASLDKARLDSEGIFSFIPGELAWYTGKYHGRAMLQVSENDLYLARQIIYGEPETGEYHDDHYEEDDLDEVSEPVVRCPMCGSQETGRENSIVYILLLLTVIPLLFMAVAHILGISEPFARKWKCHNCGYSWKG
jgi:tetratricopeptide (TPR) repeat protein